MPARPTALQPRAPAESSVETTHLVLPPDSNIYGTAFGGKIMQWMDIAAGIAAARHCRGPVVTVAVDDLHFAQPIKIGDVVVIRARVNHAGATSMEVGIRVEREHAHTRERQHCLTGYFIFVGVDGEGHPTRVPPVAPETDEDRRRFANGAARRERRLQERARHG